MSASRGTAVVRPDERTKSQNGRGQSTCVRRPKRKDNDETTNHFFPPNSSAPRRVFPERAVGRVGFFRFVCGYLCLQYSTFLRTRQAIFAAFEENYFAVTCRKYGRIAQAAFGTIGVLLIFPLRAKEREKENLFLNLNLNLNLNLYLYLGALHALHTALHSVTSGVTQRYIARYTVLHRALHRRCAMRAGRPLPLRRRVASRSPSARKKERKRFLLFLSFCI